MSASTRLRCSLVVILVLILPSISLDCSQYNDYDSCSATEYCSMTQLRCLCATPVNLDILFTISTSDYIGDDNFEHAIKPWLLEMTEVGINDGSTRVGWDIFSDTAQLSNIDETSYNRMELFISNIEYDGGAADLSQALQQTEEAFKNSSNTSRKINVIIMGSNPYTTTTDRSEVCQYASSIKQMGIEVVFIGIGTHWKEGRIDCLVGDTDTDIIPIDSYSMKDMNASLPIIYDFICPTTINLKITEVKPVSTISDGAHPRFVEFYSMGIQITSSDTLRFSGLINGFINGITVDQGTYVVIYNHNDGAITCDSTLCKDAVYIDCGGDGYIGCSWDESMGITDWNIKIMDNNLDSIDALQYDSNGYWPIIPEGYSYDLEYLGYNNEYGANYVRSCTKKGSPGMHAIGCSEEELQCTLTEECTLSGDTNAFCSNNECICSDIGFFPRHGSCYRIPEPSNCTAYIIHNDTEKYTRFEFEGADMDMYGEYGVRYYQKGLSDDDMVTVIDVSRIRSENDLYFSLQHTAGYVYTQFTVPTPSFAPTWTSPKWNVNCSIITQTPTVSPTAAPSATPSFAPTSSPTSSPTWELPNVFLSGDFCDRDRCDCFDEHFDCCLMDTAKCSDNTLIYNLENDGLIYHSIKMIPETYPFPTLIHWKVTYMNQTLNNISNASDAMGITVQPMYGHNWINATTSVNIPLILNETHMEYDEIETRAVFIFEIVDCWTYNNEDIQSDCNVIYPLRLFMVVERNDDSGVYVGGAGKVSKWIWIVLIACGTFLLLLSWLLYRYWYKGRKQSMDYRKLGDEIEFQKAYNDEDITTRLLNADTNFNPLATGMPAEDKTHDPLTAERQKRELVQQDDIVDQDAEKQVFKSEMGQVMGRKTVSQMK